MRITRGKIVAAQKIVIYGPEGIGKSTFAAQFPNPLFIDTEGSTKHMEVARLDRPSSWTMLLGEVRDVRAEPSVCQTLVLDTADWAEQLCIRHICDKAQKTGIEDFGYGKGYVYVMEEFGKLLNLLEEAVESGVNVVVTAHARMRKFEQPDEMGAYDRWELKMGEKTRALLKEWADMVLLANYKTITIRTETNKVKAQGGQRVMYTAHHPCWDAKNRHGLADELPFEFASIAHCVTTSTLPAGQSAPPVSPPPEGSTPPADERMVVSAPLPPPASPPPAETEGGLPKSLQDLMSKEHVTENEIRQVVALKGYYPQDTPIEKYDPQFVSGVLIGAWDKVLAMIQSEIRDLPF